MVKAFLCIFLTGTTVLWSGVLLADEAEDKALKKQCKSLSSALSKQLGNLTGKDLIKDGATLGKANLLLSLHGQMGCDPAPLAKTLPNKLK